MKRIGYYNHSPTFNESDLAGIGTKIIRFIKRSRGIFVLFKAQPKTIFATKKIGIDLTHFSHTLDDRAVRHILKRHSSINASLSKHELPISLEDFRKIPRILTDPDNINLSSKKTGRGLSAIVYSKRFDNQIIYIEEIQSGKRQLALKTMYKNRTSPEMVVPHRGVPTSRPTLLPTKSGHNSKRNIAEK